MLKPFISYFGGKFRAASKYPKPIYTKIIEPFAGSLGYSIRYYDRQIEAYDLDEDLVCVWNYLINASYEDIIKLPVIGDFKHINEINVPEGAKILISYGLNSGACGRHYVPSAWAIENEGKNATFWYKKRRERTALQVSKIKHWKYIRDTYQNIPNEYATWFIDPPYQVQGSNYKYGSSSINYKELGDWCKSRKGQVIVCEQEGADWMEWTNKIFIKGNSGFYREGTSSEVFWYKEEKINWQEMKERRV